MWALTCWTGNLYFRLQNFHMCVCVWLCVFKCVSLGGWGWSRSPPVTIIILTHPHQCNNLNSRPWIVSPYIEGQLGGGGRRGRRQNPPVRTQNARIAIGNNSRYGYAISTWVRNRDVATWPTHVDIEEARSADPKKLVSHATLHWFVSLCVCALLHLPTWLNPVLDLVKVLRVEEGGVHDPLPLASQPLENLDRGQQEAEAAECDHGPDQDQGGHLANFPPARQRQGGRVGKTISLGRSLLTHSIPTVNSNSSFFSSLKPKKTVGLSGSCCILPTQTT